VAIPAPATTAEAVDMVLTGLREWQGQKYPTTQWPAIIDTDTHERLVKLFGDPARRKHVVRAPAHLLSGIATCPKCGRGLHYRHHPSDRADCYGCVKGPAGCGGTAIKADLLEQYVTGALDNRSSIGNQNMASTSGSDRTTVIPGTTLASAWPRTICTALRPTAAPAAQKAALSSTNRAAAAVTPSASNACR
jgi:hypothetical protein